MAKPKLILDYVYDHEAKLADRVYLTQPVGGGQVQQVHAPQRAALSSWAIAGSWGISVRRAWIASGSGVTPARPSTPP